MKRHKIKHDLHNDLLISRSPTRNAITQPARTYAELQKATLRAQQELLKRNY